MQIRLSGKRREEAFWVLAAFVLIVVLLFLGGFLTISARAKKFKPRQLPPEETNAVNIIQMNWFAANAPTHQNPPPISATPTLSWSFTNELVFPWYEGMNGWLIVWRTDNWRDYTLLSCILFESECRYRTNEFGKVFVVMGFVDQYPLQEQAFYGGVIATNSP